MVSLLTLVQEGSTVFKFLEGVLEGIESWMHHDCPISILWHPRMSQELGAESQCAGEHVLNQLVHYMPILTQEAPMERKWSYISLIQKPKNLKNQLLAPEYQVRTSMN